MKGVRGFMKNSSIDEMRVSSKIQGNEQGDGPTCVRERDVWWLSRLGSVLEGSKEGGCTRHGSRVLS